MAIKHGNNYRITKMLNTICIYTQITLITNTNTNKARFKKAKLWQKRVNKNQATNTKQNNKSKIEFSKVDLYCSQCTEFQPVINTQVVQ